MIEFLTAALFIYFVGFFITVVVLCEFNNLMGAKIDKKVVWCSLYWMNFWYRFGISTLKPLVCKFRGVK